MTRKLEGKIQGGGGSRGGGSRGGSSELIMHNMPYLTSSGFHVLTKAKFW